MPFFLPLSPYSFQIAVKFRTIELFQKKNKTKQHERNQKKPVESKKKHIMLVMKRVKVPEKMENEIWQNVVNFNGLARWQNTLLVMIFKIDPITVRFEHSFMYRF